MATIWIIFIAIAVAGWIVQGTLQSRFKKYSKIPLRNGMTGKEVAERCCTTTGSTMYR
jgi:Zn-dependent membrane protease YugP